MDTFDTVVHYLEKAGLTYRQSILLLGKLLWEEKDLISEKKIEDIIETYQKKEV